MRVFWKLAPTALAAVALVLVSIQTVRLNRLRSRAPGAARTAPEAPEGEARLRRMEQRVARLEQAVQRLVSLALTRRPAAAGEARPDPVLLGWLKREVASLRDEVDDVVAGQAVSGEAGRKRLRKLLQEARQEERRKRRQRWAQVAAQLQQATLQRFAEEAGVPAETVTRLDQRLADERQRLFALFDAFRQGQKDLPTALSEARQILTSTDAEARRLLTDSQYEAYQKMRDDMPGMRRLRRLGLRPRQPGRAPGQ